MFIKRFSLLTIPVIWFYGYIWLLLYVVSLSPTHLPVPHLMYTIVFLTLFPVAYSVHEVLPGLFPLKLCTQGF